MGYTFCWLDISSWNSDTLHYRINIMNFLRNVTLVLLIFFGWGLKTAASGQMKTEYSYIFLNEYLCSCNETINTGPLFFASKDYPQRNHSHLISRQSLNAKETIFLWIDLEDKDTSSRVSSISAGKVSLPKEIRINHQDNKVTPKFLPLFLLESSFLL